jgi:metal-responsive CopG/Arc/MetJ family transcriptional regulator
MKSQASTLTVSMPAGMAKEIQYLAETEHRTVSELVREAFRQYKAQANLKELATEGRKASRRKGLKPKDFGGPFAR